MATITKRDDYQWQAKIRRRGYPAQSKTFETRADAEAWARDIESKMDRGVFVDRSELEKTVFKTLIERYREEVTPTKKGARKELSKLKILEASKLATMSLANIRPGDVVDYRNERVKKVSAATVIKEINLLSGIFNTAISEWKMSGLTNPVEGVRRLPIGMPPPKPRDRRLLDLTFDGKTELDWILEATQSQVLKSILPLAVESAMRRGEMVSFKPEDVSLHRQTVRLNETKNGDARVVPLSRAAVEVLRGLPESDKGGVFGVVPDSVTQAFSRALKRARAAYERWCAESGHHAHPKFLKNLRLHDLRHEGTSRLFEDKGLNVPEVSTITGHKDLRSLKRYTHLNAEKLAKRLG